MLLIFCLVASFLLPGNCFAQESAVEFDELVVTLRGRDIGTTEIPALVIGANVYLPVTDLFNFLTIRNSLAASAYSITGHIQNPADIFTINRIDKQIYYRDSLYPLQKQDIIFNESEFYLDARYFGKVFGLECKFNFRSLSIDFSTKIELPFMREKRLDQMRRNLTRVTGEIKPDSILKPGFTLFNLGALDWTIANSSRNGNNQLTAKVGIGAVLAGGELNAQINIAGTAVQELRNQQFLWRYVNNDRTFVKQISVGRVASTGTFSAVPSLLGFQLNNTATRQRRSFGSYFVTDITEPGWVVELYVNDILVNYTKADASGTFSFEVPLVYGNSILKYKFYGPWGEERSSEQAINIPFTFLPKNVFDYSITTGSTGDSSGRLFSRLIANYGVTNRFTFGSGLEYNQALQSRRNLPFMNASFRIGKSIIMSAEYSPGTVLRSSTNFRLKNKLQVEAMLVKYAMNQTAIRTVSLEDRKLMASIPFTLKKFAGFTRFSFNQSRFYKGELKTAELLASATRGRINSNITTYAVFFDRPEIMTRLAFNIALPFKLRFTPQVQYHYQQKTFVLIKAEAEKRAFKNMVATIGYEKNQLLGSSGFSVGLRHNFSFAQVGVSARQMGDIVTLTQAASGGIVRTGKKITTSDRSEVGKGTLLIVPFLDNNFNGKKDKDEPPALNLNVRVDGCRIDRNASDGTIKISSLEAYNKYYLVLDDKSFDNPAYRISHKVMEVTAMPNTTREILIPVAVMGEAGGFVNVKTDSSSKGIGRVIICFYNEKEIMVGKTMSEPDGYFSYLGLPPGNYYATVSQSQLEKIKMRQVNGQFQFSIKASKEGDIVDNIQLQLEAIDR